MPAPAPVLKRFCQLLVCASSCLAADNEPPRRWKAEDFGGVLSVGLEGHRSFGAGRSLFTQTCGACHRLGTHGGGDAPDLTRRSLTYTPEELLENILKPASHPPAPKGLLDTLKQEQVLDLLAFVLSGADAKSPFFFHP
jgi:mono/diheme cytochrome c family protein